MRIEVNVRKRYFFIILGAILLLGIIGIGYAFGTNNPQVFGHSADEIQGVCKTDGTGCPSIGGVPTGMIIMFDSNCPDGWTHFSSLDDRFPLGSNEGTVNVNRQSGESSNVGETSAIPSGGVRGGNDDEVTAAIGARLQVPYRKVVFCKKN